MEAADEGQQFADAGQPHGVPDDVDPSGVAAPGDDDKSPAAHVDDECLVVDDRGIEQQRAARVPALDGDQGGEAMLGTQPRDGLATGELPRGGPPGAHRRPDDAFGRGQQDVEGVVDHRHDPDLVGLGQRHRVNSRSLLDASR
ncbi:hypothetical protein [Streptomyces lydicus]|uniref:hypothetical protein n=1 Tax=Streptomyces lydicus TaxID=47763 RepID=UPI003807E5D7